MTDLALVGQREPEITWLDRLHSALRIDFAGEVILAGSGGPALMGQPCAVPDCGRGAQTNALCGSHGHNWRAAGKPPIESWVGSAPPRRQGVLALRPCDAPGCHRGRTESGLCQTHFLRWKRAGRPDRVSWLETAGGSPLRRLPGCAIPGCELQAEGRGGLCCSHDARWVRHGRPGRDAFIVECTTFGGDRFDLRHLPAVMRAEVAYGLQQRADEQRTLTRPDQLHALFVRLTSSEATSLREHGRDEWLTILGWRDRMKVDRRFLEDTLERLEDLAEGAGWDHEFEKDVWKLRRLGLPFRDRQLRFDAIAPEWLRSLTKRWCRWRLSTGIGVTSVQVGLRVIVEFATRYPQLQAGPVAFTRELLEEHLAHLAIRYPHPKTRIQRISSLAGLLRVARQHDWRPRPAALADIFRDDYPRLDAPAPRSVNEAVMVQLELRTNLDRFTDVQARDLAELLMGTGLRVSDGCRLPIDCLVTDQHGAAYLRYSNHKMRREALVPLDSHLAAVVARRQGEVRARYPESPHLFVREKRNPEGRLAYSADTFRHRLGAWLVECDIRDQLSRPVHVTPHQWRHTYGTRLINLDVPQEVVRRLLDHTTAQMTAVYARLSQQTIRAKWEAARKVNVQGLEVSPPEGSLADAEWMKNNLARAKMALPNGFCGLPLQQHCEYANACLTCPLFVTTVEFLPAHHRQLSDTRALIVRAERNGQERLVEMNRSVEANLVAIIDALESGGSGGSGGSGEAVELDGGPVDPA